MVLPLITVGSGALRRSSRRRQQPVLRTTIALLEDDRRGDDSRLQFQTSTARVVEHELALAVWNATSIRLRRGGWGGLLDGDRVRQPVVVDRTMTLGCERLRQPCRDDRRRAATHLVSRRGRDARQFRPVLPAAEPERRRPPTSSVTLSAARAGRADRQDLHGRARTAAAPSGWMTRARRSTRAGRLGGRSTSPTACRSSPSARCTRSADGQLLRGRPRERRRHRAGHAAGSSPKGATGAFFDLFVLVANPNDTTAARRRRRYLLPGRHDRDQARHASPPTAA